MQVAGLKIVIHIFLQEMYILSEAGWHNRLQIFRLIIRLALITTLLTDEFGVCVLQASLLLWFWRFVQTHPHLLSYQNCGKGLSKKLFPNCYCNALTTL